MELHISNKSFKAASQNQHQVGNCIKRMGTYIDEFSVTLREYVIKEYNTKNNRLGNCFRYFIVSSSVYTLYGAMMMMMELTRTVVLQLQLQYMLL